MRTHTPTSIVSVALSVLCLLAVAAPAAAQSQFEAGAQLAIAKSGALDGADIGIGARFAWLATPAFGLEGELNLYPRELPDDGVAFSSGRVEALFGATFGPRYGAFRPFARIRPGVLRIQEASAPIACVLIFPPPLACVLAAGKTLFALDVGGGAEVNLTDRTFARVDLGDRIVRYPGPAFDDGTAHSGDFLGHDFRFTIGGGVRF